MTALHKHPKYAHLPRDIVVRIVCLDGNGPFSRADNLTALIKVSERYNREGETWVSYYYGTAATLAEVAPEIERLSWESSWQRKHKFAFKDEISLKKWCGLTAPERLRQFRACAHEGLLEVVIMEVSVAHYVGDEVIYVVGSEEVLYTINL